jgi:sialic acid synthase SpsE
MKDQKKEFSSVISVDGKQIGENEPTYFIAEIGSNFDQDLSRAKDLIFLAKEAGADAAKFQHYTADTLVSDLGFKSLGNKKSHQASWDKSVFDTYDEASLNFEWTRELKETCDDANITFFTSPYSFRLVDLVDDYVPAFKIGSGDITWTKIIDHIASKGKPVFLATGASDIKDVNRAVKTISKRNNNMVLMQCNTNYTADDLNFSNIQLNVIKSFSKLYPGIITGISDHMPGHTAVLGAVALGAKVVEKHFTDSTARTGPDHPFSMTPRTWKEMVDKTRELESALGDGIKKIENNEKDTIVVQQRSICSSADLVKGSVINENNIDYLRPCPSHALKPYESLQIIGKKINKDIKKGEIIKMEYFE